MSTRHVKRWQLVTLISLLAANRFQLLKFCIWWMREIIDTRWYPEETSFYLPSCPWCQIYICKPHICMYNNEDNSLGCAWMMSLMYVWHFFNLNLGIFSRWLMTRINALQESSSWWPFLISWTLSCGTSYDTVVGAADEYITPLLSLHPVCHLETWTIGCFSQYFLTHSIIMWERNQFPLPEKPWTSIQVSSAKF